MSGEARLVREGQGQQGVELGLERVGCEEGGGGAGGASTASIYKMLFTWLHLRTLNRTLHFKSC